MNTDANIQSTMAHLKVETRLKGVPGARKVARFFGLLPREATHRQFLLKMLPQNSVGAEIGVHEGEFSAEILATVRPREFHLIDPWLHEDSDTYKTALYGGQMKSGQSGMDDRFQAVQLRFAAEIGAGRVKIHRAFSGAALERFPDGYFDWIYIDGNHLYEFVKQDLELAVKKTKPGAFIAGDDYEAEGWWKGGVKKAVDEFVHSNSAELLAIHNDQFFLRR